jgi:hypothetical protein
VQLTDEQFIEEMAQRREKLQIGPNDHVIGCPLCAVEDIELPEEYERRSEATEEDDSEADDADEASDGDEPDVDATDEPDGETPSENADGADAPNPANR